MFTRYPIRTQKSRDLHLRNSKDLELGPRPASAYLHRPMQAGREKSADLVLVAFAGGENGTGFLAAEEA